MKNSWKTLAWTFLLIVCAFSISHAQEKSRPKIGLVLSGGGARGFAHIGVLQWFEEHRIPVDYIAGTSMGGLIGGLYAIGKTPEELKQISNEIDWVDLFRPVPAYDTLDFRRKQDRRAYPNAIELGLKKGVKLPAGLNSGHQIGIILSDLTLPYSNIENFDQLPIPFRCIATDMIAAEPVILSGGSLALALQATMSIPGVFVPVEIDNKILASDGGLLNNLPTDVMSQMGVDIIIAVDIGTPLGGPQSMTSIGGVLSQMIGVVTIENVRRNRELADVLIVPTLKQFLMMDFDAAREITELGYAGTEAEKTELLRYALSEEEWKQYMDERRSRIRSSVPAPEFITVTGATAAAGREIESKLDEFVGQPIDTKVLNHEITEIWGRGRYLSLAYRMTEKDDHAGLLVHATEKTYAPPFLNIALELNNTRTDVLDVNLRGRVTFMDYLSEGSEIRLDGSLGSQVSIAGEYYYVVKPTNFFIAPRAFSEKTKTGIFIEDEQVAQYSIRRTAIGADIGYEFGSVGEIRIGYLVGRLEASREIGDPLLQDVGGEESEASLRFLIDNTDSAVIPTRGLLLGSNFRYVFDSPIAEGSVEDESFAQYSIRGSAFFPISSKNTIFLIGEADTSFDRNVSEIEKFTIGGLFRVSGLSNNEFRGDHAIMGGVGYLRKIANMPPLLGEKITAGIWYELGAAFDDSETADYFHSISVGAFVETILGPVFLGGSLAERGRSNFYFAIGRFF